MYWDDYNYWNLSDSERKEIDLAEKKKDIRQTIIVSLALTIPTFLAFLLEMLA